MSVSSLRSFEYLESLPGTVFNRLYKQPSTALAIFRRMLPHLAKSFVMALLYLSQPLPVTDLESWVRLESKRDRDHALNILERLHILNVVANPGQPRSYSLTNPFAASLRIALTGGGKHKSFGVPCHTAAREAISIANLDEFARKQWEGILGYVVGSTGVGLVSEGVTLSDGVKTLLQLGGLVEVEHKKVEITRDGFAFVLHDVNTQLWTVLILYLENAEQLGMDSVDVLSFLFMLGSLELGQSYSKANLTPTEAQMLLDLGDYGIIYQNSSFPSRYYPTRLATALTSDAGAFRSASFSSNSGLITSAASSDPADGGYIILETNFRIYAYTSSVLQIAILQLFVRLATRYPNMISGKITRGSIRRAVMMGITADQIISFISTHAHPQMRKREKTLVLPPTVVDQIRLWQIERERMKATTGFLFKDFINAAEFESPCRYAEEIGVLVWKNEPRRMFFVTRHEQIAAYLRNRPKKAGWNSSSEYQGK